MFLVNLGSKLTSVLVIFKSCQSRKKPSSHEAASETIIDETIAIEESRHPHDTSTRVCPHWEKQDFEIPHTTLSPPNYRREEHGDSFPYNTESVSREYRQVFSLSPFPIEQEPQERSETPMSYISQINSYRVPTPFQAGLGNVWRGPTPPWTMNKY
ncbi:hypothetical protein BY458DRAFT_588615 [Sporodiniella umbellata]|nr:hypothetical protein BY458DRAFT_588615 [Sporodiniella umbellata]